MRGRFWLLALALCSVALAVEIPVALVSDPPPAIDGSAERLAKLPTFRMICGRSHVLYGPGNWTGDADLSAEMVVGYDKLHLYVGAKVHDDVFRQTYFGRDLWKGDHVMLVVDYPRQRNGADADLSKVARIGLSPGDFGRNKPEAHAWSPVGLDVSGVRVAAQRTADGYTLEAAIPWSALKMTPASSAVTLHSSTCPPLSARYVCFFPVPKNVSAGRSEIFCAGTPSGEMTALCSPAST